MWLLMLILVNYKRIIIRSLFWQYCLPVLLTCWYCIAFVWQFNFLENLIAKYMFEFRMPILIDVFYERGVLWQIC